MQLPGLSMAQRVAVVSRDTEIYVVGPLGDSVARRTRRRSTLTWLTARRRIVRLPVVPTGRESISKPCFSKDWRERRGSRYSAGTVDLQLLSIEHIRILGQHHRHDLSNHSQIHLLLL